MACLSFFLRARFSSFVKAMEEWCDCERLGIVVVVVVVVFVRLDSVFVFLEDVEADEIDIACDCDCACDSTCACGCGCDCDCICMCMFWSSCSLRCMTRSVRPIVVIPWMPLLVPFRLASDEDWMHPMMYFINRSLYYFEFRWW